MKRKLLAVALALALIGMTGSGVTATESGPVVADYDVAEDLSPTPDDEKIVDGGSGCDTAIDGPSTNDEKIVDGGSC